MINPYKFLNLEIHIYQNFHFKTLNSAGHPEGIFDSMGNIYNGVARKKKVSKNFDGGFPTLEEGVRGMKFIEKVVESNAKGNIWLNLLNNYNMKTIKGPAIFLAQFVDSKALIQFLRWNV